MVSPYNLTIMLDYYYTVTIFGKTFGKSTMDTEFFPEYLDQVMLVNVFFVLSVGQ